MSYKKLLTHRCDVYHLKERNVVGGGNWGVPDDDFQKEFYYDDEPDITDVHCYFTERNQSIIQLDPNNKKIEVLLGQFLKSEDIRTNSKVMWEGEVYKMQKPRLIKNHHKEVTIISEGNL